MADAQKRACSMRRRRQHLIFPILSWKNLFTVDCQETIILHPGEMRTTPHWPQCGTSYCIAVSYSVPCFIIGKRACPSGPILVTNRQLKYIFSTVSTPFSSLRNAYVESDASTLSLFCAAIAMNNHTSADFMSGANNSPSLYKHLLLLVAHKSDAFSYLAFLQFSIDDSVCWRVVLLNILPLCTSLATLRGLCSWIWWYKLWSSMMPPSSQAYWENRNRSQDVWISWSTGTHFLILLEVDIPQSPFENLAVQVVKRHVVISSR